MSNIALLDISGRCCFSYRSLHVVVISDQKVSGNSCHNDPHYILQRSYYEINTSSLFGQIIFNHQRIQINIYTQLKMLLRN